MDVESRTEPRSSDPSWSGTVALGNGVLVYIGPGSSASSHRHDAIQLTWCPTRAFDLRTENGSVTSHAALVPPWQRHDPSDLDDRLAGLGLPEAGNAVTLVDWSRDVLDRVVGGRDDPDTFYRSAGTNLSGARRLLYRMAIRHVMNRTVARIRSTADPEDAAERRPAIS